jgi:hypothetical protein
MPSDMFLYVVFTCRGMWFRRLYLVVNSSVGQEKPRRLAARFQVKVDELDLDSREHVIIVVYRTVRVHHLPICDDDDAAM